MGAVSTQVLVISLEQVDKIPLPGDTMVSHEVEDVFGFPYSYYPPTERRPSQERS